MCAIIYLPAGTSLSTAHLTNCVYNNAHGFGIVTNVDGKLDVYKHFDEKGNDPEHVEEELKKRNNLDRYLHLRYATVGAKNLDNTHPFTVYEGNDNHSIVFMHNGGFYDFKTNENKDISDTRSFSEKLLHPLLQKFHGDNGIADIEDEVLEKILSKYFSSTNRGLLISNKLTPLFLGEWKTFESNNHKFVVSNNDYFTLVTDSRLTDYFKEKRAKDRTFHSSSTQSTTTTGTPNYSGGYPRLAYDDQKAKEAGATKDQITLLKEVDLSKTTRFLLPADISTLVGDINNLDTELLPVFNFLTSTEILRFVESEAEAATRLIEWLGYTCNILDEDLRVSTEKKDKGEKLIAQLQNRINSQTGIINSQGATNGELKTIIESKDREILELEKKLNALTGKVNSKTKAA